MRLYYVSRLGTGPGGLMFCLGLILAGFIAIPFFIFLGRILQQENVNEKMRKNAVKFSVISCICLSIVGFFPAYNFTMLLIHGIFAATFFCCGFIFCILFSILIKNDVRFSRYQAYLGFIVSVIFGAFIFTIMPITEWIVFFTIVFWVSEMGIYTLYKRF